MFMYSTKTPKGYLNIEVALEDFFCFVFQKASTELCAKTECTNITKLGIGCFEYSHLSKLASSTLVVLMCSQKKKKGRE